MIIFGRRSKVIGQQLVSHRCLECNGSEQFAVGVQRYFHIYWIPTIPTGRDFFLQCSHCRKVTDVTNKNTVANVSVSRLREMFKTPLYAYSGSAVLAGLFCYVRLFVS